MYIQNKTRSSMITIRRILAVCCCCLSLFLCACSSQPVEKENNIFLYAIDAGESLLHPKNVNYDMSVEEVLQAEQLKEYEVDNQMGEDKPRIMASLSISGLSDEITAIFSFENDKLVTVEYVITVPESDFEKVCETLQEQATSAIPADLLMGENNIREGKTAMWEDEEKNMVFLSFPITNTPESRTIILQLSRTRKREL